MQKDIWDKLDILSKILGTLLVPILVGVVGLWALMGGGGGRAWICAISSSSSDPSGHVNAIQKLSASPNTKNFVLPADILGAVKGIAGRSM